MEEYKKKSMQEIWNLTYFIFIKFYDSEQKLNLH